MELTALCITSVMLVFLLLGLVQSGDAEFQIVPNQLQVFEYDSVSFRCEGFDGLGGLRGIRNTEGFMSGCDFKESCTVLRAYPTDSGEYWCEAEGGQSSSRVNITITTGPVVLESPVSPVVEGTDVTLRCRNRTASPNITAHFYRDSVLIGNSSAGEMVVYRVSRSDAGLYKCHISEAGESPESRLSVRAPHTENHLAQVFLTFRTTFIVLTLVLMLLLLGLLHWGKLGYFSTAETTEDQTETSSYI